VKAQSQIISSIPGRFESERAELLNLLVERGILYQSPTQPVLSRDGSSARWMLNSLALTLTPRGAELAGRCLLDLLEKFDGRQLATYGLTGVPIVQSCINLSRGRYHGLLIRKERKAHGSLKLIEGPIDYNEPTILIDDSISSGMSVTEGCKRLEEVGIRVEGAVCLVRFGWYAGFGILRERGYHVEALYDVYEDLMANMDDEPSPIYNPSKWFPQFQWHDERAPEGLHPAHLARTVLNEYFTSARLLRPPRRLDREYDSAGGAWVSVRSKENIYDRHGRDGFWHFPDEEIWSTPENVVRACLRTAVNLPQCDAGKELLRKSNIAVTFFSALEDRTVGELDNDRYGIVVCSKERPSVMGGALPRMPGIAGEWEQFQHARKKNGRLVSFEPFVIYRHEVAKFVEPEGFWQPTGTPLDQGSKWHDDAAVCAPIAERARDIVIAHLLGIDEKTSPLPGDILPSDVDSVYVTVYLKGALRGCMGSRIRDLDADVRNLATAALSDHRFDEALSPIESDDVAVTVSLLYDPLELGPWEPNEVGSCIRIGQQALMAHQPGKVGLLLPFVAVMQNLNREAFVKAILEKAGITEGPYNWCRFECATWLADKTGTHHIDGSFPQAVAAGSRDELLNRFAELHINYLMKHQKEDGSFYSTYLPFQNRLYEAVQTPRLAHGAWVLARAAKIFPGDDVREAADRAISYHLDKVTDHHGNLWVDYPGEQASVAEVSFLLLALCQLEVTDELRKYASGLSSTLVSSIDKHGRIVTHRDPSECHDVYQDYFPGQTLLALATAVQAGLADIEIEKLHNAFKYYRHRFRYKRDFGQVSWLMQAFSVWWNIVRDKQFADFVYEIGDWILQYQQEKTGAFVNDHQPDTPGYTTALYLEGIAAAAHLASSQCDDRLAARYIDSFERGLRFLDKLIIQERDATILRCPQFAIGGLRQSVYRSENRIDFVQHSLSAILEFRKSGFETFK